MVLRWFTKVPPSTRSELQGRQKNSLTSKKAALIISGDAILHLGRREKLGIYHNLEICER